jgi:formylglycine-generating enzyme required for sulfatase activity
MTWDEAIQYAQNLRLGGFSDWRLPTRAELRELGEGGTDPAFKIKGGWGWSSELRASSSDWCSNFSTGQESWLTRDNFYRDKRALVVRFQR